MTKTNLEEVLSGRIPLPVCFVDSNGKISAVSPKIGEVFLYDSLTGTDFFALTGISKEQLKDAAREGGDLTLRSNGKTFKINISFTDEDGEMVLFFTDMTELAAMTARYKKEQPCFAVVAVDNYDELVSSTADENRQSVMTQIDKCIRNWGASIEASVTRYNSHSYMLVFERSYFDQQERSRFPVLDEVREIDTDGDFPITLSIGIGIGGQNPLANDDSACEALDLALARGGDQAVVKEGDHISFYGGRTQTVEKGNKGKSRIIGHALCRLIDAASNVLIMGHRDPDMDAFGAALGMYRLAKPRNKNTYIVVNSYNDALSVIYKAAETTGEYDIIKNARAKSLADKDTLVIVVDTHRPSICECPELLLLGGNIAVIDHHRKGGEFIHNPTLAYAEPYASSASELVTEILQYTIERRFLKKIEAEALLAGMMVDTNRFSVKTGVRTFEAAAWLKRAGADIADVKRFFQGDKETFRLRAQGILAAEFSENGGAYSICEGQNENAQIINSQIADELLTVRGVKASFVAGVNAHGQTVISARSIGDINVQTIMEEFGGGGHMNTAGAQMDIAPEEAIEQIRKIAEKEL